MKKEYDFKKLKKREDANSRSKCCKIPIGLRVDGSILAALKDEAEKLGLPYQTFTSSILHQYVNNELIDKKTVGILKSFKASQLLKSTPNRTSFI